MGLTGSVKALARDRAMTGAALVAVVVCAVMAMTDLCAGAQGPDTGAKVVTVQWDGASKAPWLASVEFEPMYGARILAVEKMAEEGMMQGRRIRLSANVPAQEEAGQPATGPQKKPPQPLREKPGFAVRLAGDRGFRIELEELETTGFMWLKSLGMFVSAAGSWQETAERRQAMEREAAANAEKPFRALFEKQRTFQQDFKGPPEVLSAAGAQSKTWRWTILRRLPYWPLEPRATQRIPLMPEADFDYFAQRVDPSLEWVRGGSLFLGWKDNVKEFEISPAATSHEVSLNEFGGQAKYGYPGTPPWSLRIDLGQGGKLSGQLEGGYHLIPTYTRRSADGAVEVRKTYLVHPREPGTTKTGNDPLLLHVRVAVTNHTAVERKEPVRLQLYRKDGTDALEAKDGYLSCVKGALARLPAELPWRVSAAGPEATVESEVSVPANGKKELDFAWSDAALAAEEREKLGRLSFDQAHQAARAYWDAFMERGASVHVPDPHVLNRHLTFRPRGVIINDLTADGSLYTPTSISSAYDGKCWPTCTAPAIGYSFAPMGYFDVARAMLEFLLAQQRSKSGAFTGAFSWYAHHGWVQWAAARYYMLSRDKEFAAKHLDVLLGSLRYTREQRALTKATGPDAFNYGCLPPGAVNDGDSGVSSIFSEASCWVGMKSLAEVLSDLKHPGAEEWTREAESYRADILRAFRRGMWKKRPVRLNDGTYAIVPPALLEKPEYEYGSGRWLPGITDCGYMGALETGILAGEPEEGWIIDHVNDNLYLTCIGLADEPFYSGQLNAHLRRDEVKHFLYTFYSLAANGFNLHHLTTYEFSPAGKQELTHWAQGHYDGAFFGMLCRQDGKTLRLCQATPRRWLEDGKEIKLERYYTDFGPITFKVVSRLNSGTVEATIEPPTRNRCEGIVLRLRVPEGRKMKNITVNGAAHEAFDAAREEISLELRGEKLLVVARFE